MIVLEMKAVLKSSQSNAIDDAIRLKKLAVLMAKNISQLKNELYQIRF
jgi:hypothetical protein